jgi:hypothetical protein
MKLKRIIALGLALALLGFAWSCDNSDDNKAEPKGTISGTVTIAETTTPIANATVSVLTTDRTATTGADGVYTIGDVVPGTYTVQFTMTGYDNRQITNVTVTDGLTTTANATMEVTGGADHASGTISSDETGTITTPGGARIVVPIGAVPPTDQGGVGTMTFSIEKNNSVPITVPSGETQVSDVYVFGPAGFTFARPVEISVPLRAGQNPAEVSLWRMNPTTGLAEFYSTNYDEVTRTVSAQTYQFTPWFLSEHDPGASSSGCIRVSNLSLSSWLYVCVDEVALEYPEQTDWLPTDGGGVTYAPIGTIGWASEGNWYMPQGTYRLCLQRESEVTPGEYGHIFVDNVAVSEPWHRDDPHCTNISSGILVDAIAGRCACIPTFTTSVGTGDIQVTLTWWNANALDLDLHVMDPTGVECYFGNGQYPGTTSTGAQLDRDNLCSNYVNGRPENIYWTTTPPTGEYIVSVDWWSACGNEITSQSIEVRTVVGANTQTYFRTIQAEEMLEVVRFTLAGGVATFAEGAGKVARPDIPRNAKD